MSQQLQLVTPAYPLLFTYWKGGHGAGGRRGVYPSGERGPALIDILERGHRHGVEEIFIPRYICKYRVSQKNYL